MFRFFSLLIILCLMLAGTASADFPITPLWHPQTSGTTMTEYVYIPVGGPSIRWAEHAGFTIALDDSRLYDNWSGVDEAPQVSLSLTNPAELGHLRYQDFVATVQVSLESDRGHKYHTGLCVTLEDGTTMVWGPHGSGDVGAPGTDLRFRRPSGVSQWQPYGKTTVLLKLKRRYLTIPRRDIYSAWFSEDGHIWEKAAETTIASASANEPVNVGVMLKNWGQIPHDELVTFKHFDITHVGNEPASYADNVQYSFTDANAPVFKYNLSGIEILFRVMVRNAVPSGVNPNNVKLYVIHGSGTELDNPSGPSNGPEHYEARTDFNRITNRLRETGYGYNDENLIVIAPRFRRGSHPYPDRMSFQYQNLQGEEDWMLIDLHEDYVRERFRADSAGMDDTFLILGHSGGGQYVTRFSMAHAEKLEMAVASSPASTAYPTYNYAWPFGIYLLTDFSNSNPRFSIDLVSALGLPMAVVMGECDVLFGGGNEEERYNMNVGGYARQDNARKWVRQMVFPTHEVFICPKTGHGYALEKQILSLVYLFGDATDSVENPADPVGDPTDWATMDQWKYTYTMDLQDQEYAVSPLLLLTLWVDRIHYFKFERYSRPAGEAQARYQFWPDSSTCTVWDGKGNPIGAGTYTLTQGAETFELTVYDGTIWETFTSPKLYYGKLRFYSDDYMLQESAAVTPVFIDEQVVGRRLNMYTCTDRYPTGPVAGNIAVGPFPEDTIILNSDGSVTDADTGLSPTDSTMRYWYFHTHRNLLYFMTEACRNDLVFLADPDPAAACLNNIRLGEWRWGYDAMGGTFLAAMSTLEQHDIYRKELQTNAIYNPRYFEEWDSAGLDFDNDAYTDILDNCPVTANTDQTDRDADGLGDVCDPLVQFLLMPCIQLLLLD